VTATELRRVRVAPPVLGTLAEGVHDPDPRVRWWCVQLLDHINDQRALIALTDALDDPVPRVRRNAAHALGCVACKPAWDESLPDVAAARLLRLLAAGDQQRVPHPGIGPPGRTSVTFSRTLAPGSGCGLKISVACQSRTICSASLNTAHPQPS
jgi:hypothetical protein